MNDTARNQVRLGELMDGYLTTQMVYVAAELGVADALAAGPRTSEGLAAELGVRADALHRVLRGLAVQGVVEELGDRRFGLTPVGELLRNGVPGSLRGPARLRGRVHYPAFTGLLDGVRAGGVPFERVNGLRLFDHLGGHPDDMALFQASMTDRSAAEADAVVAAYDFGRFRTLVDVAGGHGILLATILRAHPELSGVLFDQPQVVAEARLPERGETVEGDFFREIPAGADAYLMSRIIHDWNDEDALRILTTCRKAITAEGTLVLVETVLPERAADNPAAIRMDLHMLGLLSGRERTEQEHAALLAAAGFELTRVIETGAPTGVHVVEARPN